MSSTVELITSATNPLIKRLRSLDRKKGRSETGTFLAEGARLIAQALAQGWTVETVITGKSAAETPFIQDLVSRAAASGARAVCIPDRLLGSLTRKNNPQAVVAEIQQRRLDLDAIDVDISRLWFGLYQIRDPGNLGTILRTIDCAGAGGAVLIDQCCDPYSVEAVRASMGSIFDVALARCDLDTFNTWRLKAGLKTVAASINGKGRHTDVDFRHPSLILMGNEQAGLPPSVEAACDHLCRIPMRGGADSLNLAQASAIMLYEAWRQRGFQ